jgi:hypothetical protein
VLKYRGIRGKVALIKWSYYHAAAVEGYAVTQDASKRWTASGALVPGAIDRFKLAQRPLYFVAPFKGGAWRWEVESLELDAGRFTARLGLMTTEGSNGLARPTARN